MKPMGRFVLTVLVGSIIMFVWGGISHMTLFKGAGFTHLEKDEVVTTELGRLVPQDGLYFLPSPDFGKNADDAAFESRFRAGPTGMLVFHRSGSAPVTPRKLLMQFFSELLAAAIGAFVLSRLRAPFWLRVLTMGLLGAFGVLSISTIYWNWYGFPDAFFAAQLVDKVAGWLMAGAGMAASESIRPVSFRARAETSI